MKTGKQWRQRIHAFVRKVDRSFLVLEILRAAQAKKVHGENRVKEKVLRAKTFERKLRGTMEGLAKICFLNVKL